MVALSKQSGSHDSTRTNLTYEWPSSLYSLSHVALPFTPQDPVYGGAEAKPSPGIQLGNVDIRGERGILRVSGTDFLRLRWNPFYGIIESRIFDFMELSGSTGS